MVDRRLPVPSHLRGSTPTKKAKVEDDALPVGGAPPVTVPSFDAIPRRAVPQHTEEQQLPTQGQNPPRAPEAIKADFERAASLFNTRDNATTSSNPVSLDDVSPTADPPRTTIPANSKVAKKSVVDDEEDRDYDDGPTVGDMRDYPYDSYRKEVERQNITFNTPEIRKAIESRLEPIPTEHIVLYESVSQRFPIIPGTLEVTFRSLTAGEDMAIKDAMYKIVGSDRYVLDTLILMTLTCGLKSFNGAALPDHMITNEAGNRVLDEERMSVKLEAVKRLPLQIVALLSITYGWFDEAIRGLLVKEILGK